MTSHDLEWIRMNKFFVLSEGGCAITMDQLNEFLNLWLKSCVSLQDFQTFCDRSKHIISLRKCSYETFGKSQAQNNCAIGSQEGSVVKLVSFFEEADIFPCTSNVKRAMTPSFFWDGVQRPKKVGLVENVWDIVGECLRHSLCRTIFGVFANVGRHSIPLFWRFIARACRHQNIQSVVLRLTYNSSSAVTQVQTPPTTLASENEHV